MWGKVQPAAATVQRPQLGAVSLSSMKPTDTAGLRHILPPFSVPGSALGRQLSRLMVPGTV